MIEFLRGICLHRKPTGLTIDVQGVGYAVEVPLSTLCQAPAVGESISLWIHTHVREDAFKLYGFLTVADKDLFEILISVNGIGPKLALAILSTLAPETIRRAVTHEHIETFEAVPGIGRRMAEKILVELKSKVKKLNDMVLMPVAQTIPGMLPLDERLDFKVNEIAVDVQSALENLGFKSQVVQPLMRKLVEATTDGELDFNTLLRKALLILGGNDKSPAAMNKSPKTSSSKPVDLF